MDSVTIPTKIRLIPTAYHFFEKRSCNPFRVPSYLNHRKRQGGAESRPSALDPLTTSGLSDQRE